jgi:esterase/lipase superfamily enzyme
VSADKSKVEQFLKEKISGMGSGSGEGLAGYLSGRAESADIEAYPEKLDSKVPDKDQQTGKFGSRGFFSDLKNEMMKNSDVLVFIHGYNVSWHQAVGSALSLQLMLNRKGVDDQKQKVLVVLFSWPSDGSMFPFRAYKADRADARDSGYAVGRALLKLRDFLEDLRGQARRGEVHLCDQEIHLLSHSMGNFVLQNALQRIGEFTTGPILPRIFDHIFLCSADVDDDVLEDGKPMGWLHELARSISIYYNREDKALLISDLTKGHPERLGTNGAARPFKLHNKVHQIDCTPIVSGLVEHSYFLAGSVTTDIRRSVEGKTQTSNLRDRETTGELPNVWRMKKI